MIKFNYTIFLKISGLFLIALNLLLAVFLPFLVSSNPELVFAVFAFQSGILIPLTQLVLILFVIDFLKNNKKNTQNLSQEQLQKNENDLMGRIIGIVLAAIITLVYSFYDPKGFGIKQIAVMFGLFAAAIIAGPQIGKVYQKLTKKE